MYHIKKSRIGRHLLFSTLCLIAILASIKIYISENLKQDHKNDLIELSNVEYGLFNIDKWEFVFADVIAKKIQDFNVDELDKEGMRKKVATLLKSLIDDYEKSFKKRNSGSLSGSIKNFLYSSVSAFDDIRKDIPLFTDKIVTFLDNKNNREVVRDYLITQLKTYSENTFSKTDYTNFEAIIAKYNGESQTNTTLLLQNKIEQIDAENSVYKITLLTVFLLYILLLIFFKRFSKLEYVLSIIFSFSLLLIGILLPMIEIDARISEISFTFLNESISFKDQVLYYKSKSIFEVVILMMSQQKIELLIIGGLIFLFSVIFPLSKLISTVLYVVHSKLKKYKVVHFFVFKTGKWSMADVFVIAVFMAFIGFDGIINEQLQQIESVTKTVDILTTNKSNLLFSFFSFTGFVIFSILTSQKIHNSSISGK